jgi:hypothetical protein
MPTTKASIEGRLAQAQLAINNTIADADLSAALAKYGYTAERLRQGAALRDSARIHYQRQKSEYGNLLAARDAFDTAQRQAQATYMRQVKVARVALKHDRGALQTLNLAAQRKRTLYDWLAQAQQFYANALGAPSILDRLAAFGISEALLAEGQRQIEAVAASNAARQRRLGAARDATRARDEAIAALDSWMSDFVKIARVALQDRPQLLEKIGVPAHKRRAAHAPTLPPTLAADTLVHVAAVPPEAERRNGKPALNGQVDN